jgi:hypothetical protein
LKIFKRKKSHFESPQRIQRERKEFLFGEANGAHEIIWAIDRDAAVWKFLMKITSLWDYVPEGYKKTDSEGFWIGHYDTHTDMFIHEYTLDACIPVFVREKMEWKLIEKMSPNTVGTDISGSDSSVT